MSEINRHYVIFIPYCKLKSFAMILLLILHNSTLPCAYYICKTNVIGAVFLFILEDEQEQFIQNKYLNFISFKKLKVKMNNQYSMENQKSSPELLSCKAITSSLTNV